jgi:hypothetical protein
MRLSGIPEEAALAGYLEGNAARERALPPTTGATALRILMATVWA